MVTRFILRASLLLCLPLSLFLPALSQSVTVSPTSISFGNQAQGTTSSVHKVTLKNGQSTAITISSISTNLADFSQSNNCPVSPVTLKAGGSCMISVSFTPSAQGTENGTLTIVDTGLSSPQLVTLTGTGTAPILQWIAVAPGTASVIVANTQAFTATGTYSDGSTQSLTTASWTSSSTSIATIGLHTGLAKGVSAGTSTITATSGKISGSATLTVTAAILTSISITPSTASIAAGKTQQYKATGTYNNGTTQNLTTTATWTSSATSVATVSGSGMATTVTQGTTTITAASGTISGSATLTATAAVLVSLVAAPSTASVAAGNTQQFTATGVYTDGTSKDLTTAASWTSSATAVATIKIHTGLATSIAAGTTTIMATLGTLNGSATLTVTALTSIAITPANPSIANGTNLQFAATGTYSDGSTQDLTTTVTWSSSSASVASITVSGLATGASVGTATLTASLGSITGSTTITVTNATLVSIAVTPAIPTVPLGTTQQFTATGTFNDGTTQNITGTVQWSSDTPGVATISNNGATAGLATSVAQGTATISATSGPVTGSTKLTVTSAALLSIAITPAAPSVALGTTQQFTATGTYTDGTTQNLTTSATWSSDTPATATISNTGLATSIAQGTATISASSGSVSASTLLTVTAAALVSIAINPPTTMIALGTTQQFTATGTYTDNSTQDLTQSGHWSSTNAAIATISNTAGTAGLATTVATGTTTINVASGSITGTASLTVNPAALVSIVISPQAPSIALGNTQQFTATGTYTDNTTQDLTTVVTWSSSTAGVVVVSNTAGSNGLATSSGVGSATITATSGSISSSTTLGVTGAQLVSIAVTPTGATLAIGGALQFAATGTYTDNSTQDLTTSATWSSSNPAVAAISNNAGIQGLATGVALGGAIITAMSGSISGSSALTVGATLVSITVTPASASVVVALRQQFSATGNYSDGTTQDLTASALWSSSAPTIATIAGTGLVTGVAAGSATITASFSSIAGSATITVTSATLVSLALSPSVITVTEGGTQQFTATGTYNNGTTQDLTNSVTWSSNGGAATITATGSATAAALGSATITASSAGITGTAIFISILAGAPAAFPTLINFAPQLTGTTSSFPQTVTVYNLGSSSATITALSISNSIFRLTGGTVPVTLAAGASANFTFSFTPTKTGNAAGSATFSFDKAAKQIVQLNGVGTSSTATALLSTNSLAFGNQPLGISGAPQTVTITNGGTTLLTIQAATVTPPFFETGFVNSVRLNGGASFSFQVNYLPSVLGANNGTILLSYDVLPNQGITLSGTATAATTLGITAFPTLPGATQKAAYQATLTAAGGIGQITWSLASGSSLPSGLSLSTSGIVSGTLSSSIAPGAYSFVAQVIDSNNPPSTASTVLTLPVGSPTGAACNNTSWDVAGTTTPLAPIIDLATGYYGAYQGGLYANGSNQDDPNHHAYGVTEAGAVQPLDSNGNPSPTGKYALLTIGNSNASTISSEFVNLASADPDKNPSLVLVNGATGGASADALQDPASYFWGIMVNDYLPNAGVTSNQVEVVWLNDVDVSHPPTIPNLQAMLENVARLLIPKFPNVKLVYLSSMNYTGYSNGIDSFQPEPSAYETGFAAKAVIQDQINGAGNLNYNPGNGTVMAPWTAWSAYYWTNGLLGRSDGLTWSCQDANPDGAHPDASGQLKAAAQILSFFKTDATATPWFLSH